MYKLLFIVSIFLISCGPSKEELDAWDKMRKDSTEAANQIRIDDSISKLPLETKELSESKLFTTEEGQFFYCSNCQKLIKLN